MVRRKPQRKTITWKDNTVQNRTMQRGVDPMIDELRRLRRLPVYFPVMNIIDDRCRVVERGKLYALKYTTTVHTGLDDGYNRLASAPYWNVTWDDNTCHRYHQLPPGTLALAGDVHRFTEAKCRGTGNRVDDYHEYSVLRRVFIIDGQRCVMLDRVDLIAVE